MLVFYFLLFIICCILLYFSGEWVVGGLMRIARFLGLKEFVVAFFVMSFAASLPNLFIGITSVFHKIPELALGDISGNNLAALTLAVALGVFFTKKRKIPAQSKTVQTTSVFTAVSAILPLILILNGKLTRIEGVILIAFFFFYLYWLFSKKERFTRVYNGREAPINKKPKTFLKDFKMVGVGLLFLIFSAQGIVLSAKFFASALNLPLILVGILIVGLGSALPQIYFAIASAKRNEPWMILGNLMGSVIVPATLVLGIVVLIHPIEIADFSPFAIARIFLVISALFFFFFVKSDREITKREAVFLLFLYVLFVVCEIARA